MSTSTSVGEGADGTTVLERNGTFQTRFGGDIGNGFDEYIVVRGKLSGGGLTEVFALADELSGIDLETAPQPSAVDRASLSLELESGKTWSTEAVSDAQVAKLAAKITELVSPEVSAAADYMTPTDQHAVYEFEVKNHCDEAVRRKPNRPAYCTDWPSRFSIRADGVWQCRQSRAVTGGAEVHAIGGKGATFKPPRFKFGKPTTRSTGAHDWKVHVRSKTDKKFLADPRMGAKAWRGIAFKLSPLCWPLQKR
ncbi:MAG: hypothetical protein KJO07_24675 [Deltaproteobacteria bacterium]|nr:hypothetical protein [Deltaproteobacteria bacterium]